MEAKLAEFRAEKHRQYCRERRQRHRRALWSKITSAFRSTARFLTPTIATETFAPVVEERQEQQCLLPPGDGTSHEESLLEPGDGSGQPRSWLSLAATLLKVLLWITLFAISVMYEFGAAFFLCTAIPIMYYNTSTRRRVQGEPSAYSVFNANCEAIEGTLTAEKLQKEMMFGLG